jgi:hypothetical protein
VHLSADLELPGQPEGYLWFDPETIVVSENTAYILHENGPVLSIVDVSDPNSPELLGQYLPEASSDEGWGMAVAGDMVWLGVGHELRGINVSDPANPTEGPSIDMGGRIDQILIQGTTAYVGCMQLGMVIVDISNPNNPSIVNTVVTLGATGSIAISDSHTYIPTFGGQTAIYSDAIEPGVVARQVFYNNSSFDGNDSNANASDYNAVDTDKQALLPGQTPISDNYSSYSRGINGIMVDIQRSSQGAGDLTIGEL